MLQSIRERTQGWIAGVIVSILILSFALWGIHSYFVGGAANENVATVNGDAITKQQLSVAFDRMQRQLFAQTGTRLSSKNEEAVRARALNNLIELSVLKQASLKQGFHIYDEQVDNYLQAMREFQVNGEFSLERFQEMLAASGMLTGEFLNLIRTTLQIEQPRLGILLSSAALSDETQKSIALIEQLRHVIYITLPTDKALPGSLSISPIDVKQYYEAHQSTFMTKEQVSIEYLQLSLPALAKSIPVNDAILQAYYKDNLSTYTKPFASVKEKVKEAYQRQQAEEKFADMRERLADATYEHPESLAPAAKTLGLPVSTSGVFTADKSENGVAQNEKIRQVAFSHEVLSQQNNSDVIALNPETAIVLRVKTHIPAKLMPLDDVQSQILTVLRKKAADEKVKTLAELLEKQLVQQPDSLTTLAKSHGLTVHDMGFIGRHDTKVDSAILDAAFGLADPQSQNKSSSVSMTQLPNGYALVLVSGVKPGTVTDASQYDVFAERFATSEGLLEYELYKQSQINQAKISYS